MHPVRLLISSLIFSALLLFPPAALASGTVYVDEDRNNQWFSCTGVYDDE